MTSSIFLLFIWEISKPFSVWKTSLISFLWDYSSSSVQILCSKNHLNYFTLVIWWKFTVEFYLPKRGEKAVKSSQTLTSINEWIQLFAVAGQSSVISLLRSSGPTLNKNNSHFLFMTQQPTNPSSCKTLIGCLRLRCWMKRSINTPLLPLSNQNDRTGKSSGQNVRPRRRPPTRSLRILSGDEPAVGHLDVWRRYYDW